MIDINELTTIFAYNPRSGVLTNRVRRSTKAGPGDVCGSVDGKGYLRTKIKGRHIFVHRVCWAIYYGKYPDGDIDHIDGNRANNSIENLRVACKHENAQNLKRLPSKSGLTGAVAVGSKWQSQIRLRGKTIYLGLFDTAKDAHSEYLKKKSELHAFQPVPRWAE